mmetsp:Transcript_3633/g.8251  ORF Transcript_3633/g.8251 Transcript_3633/m.8251 type:complete len:115 (+) Transcript_3633:460-804(+)
MRTHKYSLYSGANHSSMVHTNAPRPSRLALPHQRTGMQPRKPVLSHHPSLHPFTLQAMIPTDYTEPTKILTATTQDTETECHSLLLSLLVLLPLCAGRRAELGRPLKIIPPQSR